MKKEYFEWVHSWCDCATQNDLPRILLVGDSITCGYQEKVRELLKGVCYVDYIATSYAIDSKIYNVLLENFIKDSNYDLIHFNHGLHGVHMTKRTYKSRMLKLLKKIKTDVVIATSTVVYQAGNKKLDTKWKHRLAERNSVVNELAEELGFKIDDLYSVSLSIPKEFRADDGTHYKSEGYSVLAESVVNSVKNSLNK